MTSKERRGVPSSWTTVLKEQKLNEEHSGWGRDICGLDELYELAAQQNTSPSQPANRTTKLVRKR